MLVYCRQTSFGVRKKKKRAEAHAGHQTLFGDKIRRKSIEGKPNTGNTPLVLAVADFTDPTAFGDECSYLFCGCKSGSDYDNLCASVYDHCAFVVVL